MVAPVTYLDEHCRQKRFYVGFSIQAKDPAAINDAAARGGIIDLFKSSVAKHSFIEGRRCSQDPRLSRSYSVKWQATYNP